MALLVEFALAALTLGRETVDLMASVPHMKRATRSAEVYARSEVEAILRAPRQPRDRALLITIYGCGLQISEATQLKTSDIDRPRMQLRVRNGKGAKGRVSKFVCRDGFISGISTRGPENCS